jgi:hypothetical protein
LTASEPPETGKADLLPSGRLLAPAAYRGAVHLLVPVVHLPPFGPGLGGQVAAAARLCGSSPFAGSDGVVDKGGATVETPNGWKAEPVARLDFGSYGLRWPQAPRAVPGQT